MTNSLNKTKSNKAKPDTLQTKIKAKSLSPALAVASPLNSSSPGVKHRDDEDHALTGHTQSTRHR